MKDSKIIKNHRTLKFYHFIIFSFLIAILISILDSTIVYFMYGSGSLTYLLFPPIFTQYFFYKIMIIVTFILFGIVVFFFMRRRCRDFQLLQENELRFRTIANYTKDWEYWISPKKNIIFMSPSCKNITGFSANEFHKESELISEIVYKEDYKLFAEHETLALAENEMNSIEFRITTKDKRIIWIDHSCQSVYDDNGKYIGHRVSNRDITSRKKVEEKLWETTKELEKQNLLLQKEVDFSYLELEAIISQSPYAKAIFDKDGKILKVNATWHSLFDSKFHLKNIFDIAYNNDKIKSDVEKILSDGTAFKSEAEYIEQFDRVLQISMYVVKDMSGKIAKIVCNCEDFTDQILKEDSDRELEMQKTISKKIFELLEKERKHIAKELHDQIGQKLMLVKLNSEMLKEKVPESAEKIDEIIKLIVDANREIKDIIYSFHPVELENYGLVAALDSMIQRCSMIGNFKAEIHIYGKYSAMEKEKELAIYRIGQEITSNITKHARANVANFEFHFNEDEFIGIITDDGDGFNISEFNIQGSELKSFGLISVRERAKILNGFLEVQSKINEGTKVYFHIPLKEKKNG